MVSSGYGLQDFGANDVSCLLKNVSMASGRALVEVSVTASLWLAESHPLLQPENLVGLSREQARNFFLDHPEDISEAEVKLSPFWTKTIPINTERVEFVIQPPNN